MYTFEHLLCESVTGVKFCQEIISSKATPVAERLRALFLNHSIISPLCLVWGSSPTLATFETSQVLFAGVQVVFPGVLPFSDWSVSYELK